MQLKLIKLQSSLFLLVQNCVFVLTCKQLCLCSFSWIVPMRLQWLLPNWFGPASTTASAVCVSMHFSAVCVSNAFYAPLWVQKLQQQAFRCKTIICLHRCQCISTYIRYFGGNLLQFWIWKAEQIEAADKSLGGSPVTQKSQLSRVHSGGSRAKTQRPQHKNDGNLCFWFFFPILRPSFTSSV